MFRYKVNFETLEGDPVLEPETVQAEGLREAWVVARARFGPHKVVKSVFCLDQVEGTNDTKTYHWHFEHTYGPVDDFVWRCPEDKINDLLPAVLAFASNGPLSTMFSLHEPEPSERSPIFTTADEVTDFIKRTIDADLDIED